MPKKNRPILTVFLILGGVAVFLSLTSLVVFKALGISSTLSLNEKIGVIPIEGIISDSRNILYHLDKFQKDQAIKAIILRIDSPGGSVGPSQEIYHQVRKTIRTKKVIVSMGAVAASGGYYIAAAADKIVANPGTITGSIGVIMEFFRFEELLKKIGVQLEVIKSGEFKDVGSPHRELTDRDRELLLQVITDIKNQFIEGVASGRHMPVEKVREIADGRIFTGDRAKKLGLVDALGNFQDAVDLAKEMSGIEGEVDLVYPEKRRPSLLDIIMETGIKSLKKAIQETNIPIEYRWRGLSGPFS
jgi:protease-4